MSTTTVKLSHHLVDPIDTTNLTTMWAAFSKCKSFIENGSRLENMSWRLWQYQRQPTNYIDNTTIKRFITSVLLSPATLHDADSHEVPPTVQQENKASLAMSFCSSIVVVNEEEEESEEKKDEQLPLKDQDKESKGEQQRTSNGPSIPIPEDDYDDDYYLSDEDDLYDDEEEELYDDDDDDKEDINYLFVNDFKKTQPRPTTPRRSLLSDLFGRVSSPPSLLSNSTSSFTTTSTSNHSLNEDATTNTNTTLHIALNHTTSTNKNDPSAELTNGWRESFHGW